jgi:hypothetical protein
VNRPAWFIAALLSMLAMLMGSHLWMLRVGVDECDELARISFEQARRLAAKSDKQVTVLPLNSECSNIEEDYSKVADKYLSVILALLGGAGVAGGVALRPQVSDPIAPTTAPEAPPPAPPQSTPDPPSTALPAPEGQEPTSPLEQIRQRPTL